MSADPHRPTPSASAHPGAAPGPSATPAGPRGTHHPAHTAARPFPRRSCSRACGNLRLALRRTGDSWPSPPPTALTTLSPRSGSWARTVRRPPRPSRPWTRGARAPVVARRPPAALSGGGRDTAVEQVRVIDAAGAEPTRNRRARGCSRRTGRRRGSHRYLTAEPRPDGDPIDANARPGGVRLRSWTCRAAHLERGARLGERLNFAWSDDDARNPGLAPRHVRRVAARLPEPRGPMATAGGCPAAWT